MSRRRWPEWWNWELELSPHLLKRMVDRRFTEVDLRRMLQVATRLRWDIEPGLVIDLARSGQPIGIEITAPSKITVAALNRVLTKLGLSLVTRNELAPLLAA